MADDNAQTPGWIWLLSGLVIGLFIAFLVYVKNKNDSMLNATNNSEAVQATISSSGKDEPAPTKFEFYKLLPKGEITLPQVKTRQETPPAQREMGQPNATTTVENDRSVEPGSYMLQIGSFKRYEDADTLKAKLAFSGIEADIASVTLANGQEWHRVRIGPSRDIKYINSVQDQLAQNSFNAMLMKVSN